MLVAVTGAMLMRIYSSKTGIMFKGKRQLGKYVT